MRMKSLIIGAIGMFSLAFSGIANAVTSVEGSVTVTEVNILSEKPFSQLIKCPGRGDEVMMPFAPAYLPSKAAEINIKASTRNPDLKFSHTWVFAFRVKDGSLAKEHVREAFNLVNSVYDLPSLPDTSDSKLLYVVVAWNDNVITDFSGSKLSDFVLWRDTILSKSTDVFYCEFTLDVYVPN